MNMTGREERYARAEEAAKYLGIGRGRLRRLVAAGKLHPKPATYDERVQLFPVSELQDLLKQIEIERGSGELPPKTDRSAA